MNGVHRVGPDTAFLLERSVPLTNTKNPHHRTPTRAVLSRVTTDMIYLVSNSPAPRKHNGFQGTRAILRIHGP